MLVVFDSFTASAASGFVYDGGLTGNVVGFSRENELDLPREYLMNGFIKLQWK